MAPLGVALFLPKMNPPGVCISTPPCLGSCWELPLWCKSRSFSPPPLPLSSPQRPAAVPSLPKNKQTLLPPLARLRQPLQRCLSVGALCNCLTL